MRKTLYLLALLLLLSACDGTLSRQTERDALLTGAWTLSHRELSNDCTLDSDVFPLAPGSVDVESFGDAVTLTSRGELPLTYDIEPQGWFRERHQSVDGCDLAAYEVWQFHETSRSRLSATYESRVELAGDCEFTGLSSCSVRYAVWGVRR